MLACLCDHDLSVVKCREVRLFMKNRWMFHEMPFFRQAVTGSPKFLGVNPKFLGVRIWGLLKKLQSFLGAMKKENAGDPIIGSPVSLGGALAVDATSDSEEHQ